MAFCAPYELSGVVGVASSAASVAPKTASELAKTNLGGCAHLARQASSVPLKPSTFTR